MTEIDCNFCRHGKNLCFESCWKCDSDKAERLADEAIKELRVDAERYRWLRECQSIPADILLNHHGALDAAIDAAIKEASK